MEIKEGNLWEHLQREIILSVKAWKHNRGWRGLKNLSEHLQMEHEEEQSRKLDHPVQNEEFTGKWELGKEWDTHKSQCVGKCVMEGEAPLLKDPATCREFRKHFKDTEVTGSLSSDRKYSQILFLEKEQEHQHGHWLTTRTEGPCWGRLCGHLCLGLAVKVSWPISSVCYEKEREETVTSWPLVF